MEWVDKCYTWHDLARLGCSTAIVCFSLPTLPTLLGGRPLAMIAGDSRRAKLWADGIVVGSRSCANMIPSAGWVNVPIGLCPLNVI